MLWNRRQIELYAYLAKSSHLWAYDMEPFLDLVKNLVRSSNDYNWARAKKMDFSH